MLFLLCFLLRSLSSRDTSQPAVYHVCHIHPYKSFWIFMALCGLLWYSQHSWKDLKIMCCCPEFYTFIYTSTVGGTVTASQEIEALRGSETFMSPQSSVIHECWQSQHPLLTLHQHRKWPHLLSLFWWGGRAVLWGPWRWSC